MVSKAPLVHRQLVLAKYPDEMWESAFDLADRQRFPALMGLIAQELNGLVGQSGYFELAEAMEADVVALQAGLAEGEDPTHLQYLQFEVSIGPLVNAQGIGDFGLAHDWIHNGLGNEVGHAIERTINLDRVPRFLDAGEEWIRESRAYAITDWAGTFYYYCRVRGTLAESAEAMIVPVLAAITSRPLREPGVIDSLGMILNWATTYQHPLAQPLTDLLLPLFVESEPIAQRTRIASLFATSAGTLSRKPPRFWAEWAFANGGDHLNPHERFQLVWQQVETVEDWGRLKPRALEAIRSYAAQFLALGAPTAIFRAIDQRSNLLKPAVALMQRFERSDDLLEIFTAWYGVAEETRLKSGILFVCPAFEHDTVYLGARTQRLKRDGAKQILELTGTANRMLGLTLTIEGHADDRSLFGTPNRLDPEAAPDFAAAVEKAYGLAELQDEVLSGRTALIVFPGQPHPVQALMLGARGSSLPIASSLEAPLPDRPITRALLWESAFDYYSAFELDAVEAVLAGVGVMVERRSGADAKPEDFLIAYGDPGFDLAWVAGHGEIDHWQDGSARLLAGPDCAIAIDALHAAGPRDGNRRLCFLNVCDGGVSAVNGGIHKLGMAPMLAQARQATISHLWPVNPLAASAFGVFLGDALVRADGFHAAFDIALAAIRAPLPDIAERVRSLAPKQQLADRLANATSVDISPILHWGSPVFFQ